MSEVTNIILSLNIVYLLISIAFVPILYAIRTYRWKIMLNSIGVEQPFIKLYYAMVAGICYGLLTPGKAGELCRTYYISGNRSETLTTIMVEKIMDVAILIILCTLTIPIFFNEYPTFKYLLAICFLAVVLGTLSAINRKFVNFFGYFFKIREDSKETYMISFKKLLSNRSLLLSSGLIGLGFYFVAYISAIFLLKSMGIAPLAVVSLPIIILMGNIPVTISGLGLRESVGAVCFVLLGIEGAYGVSFSLLEFLIFSVLAGLIGYILVIRGEL
ncbi:MAG: flippase-like domain-containing protein [Methanotrichaceae archaeon]|nr:flippase-like domain-containing protein [Methanotrichaceae archaeon]